MGAFRKLLVLGMGVCALSSLLAVQACTSETELNPQPLPPGTETNPPAPARDPEGKAGNDQTPSMGAGDASAGDAADGGPG